MANNNTIWPPRDLGGGTYIYRLPGETKGHILERGEMVEIARSIAIFFSCFARRGDPCKHPAWLNMTYTYCCIYCGHGHQKEDIR